MQRCCICRPEPLLAGLCCTLNQNLFLNLQLAHKKKMDEREQAALAEAVEDVVMQVRAPGLVIRVRRD